MSNLYPRHRIPNGSLVHESACEGGEEYLRRLPKDVVKVERSTRAALR